VTFEKDEVYKPIGGEDAYSCVRVFPKVVLRKVQGKRVVRNPNPDKWRKLERIPC
jgi:hypothetical protein